MTPQEQSSRIIDAAVNGGAVPGFEAVSQALGELAHTTPIAPGAALVAPGVAAASAVSAPSPLAIALASLVKPAIGLVVAVGLVGATVVIGRGGEPADSRPATPAVARTVDADTVSSDDPSVGSGAVESSVPGEGDESAVVPEPSPAPTPQPTPSTAEQPSTTATASTTTNAAPTTSAVSSTTGAPSTTEGPVATAETTTSLAPEDQADDDPADGGDGPATPNGNNGNGNGSGSGGGNNGKGKDR